MRIGASYDVSSQEQSAMLSGIRTGSGDYGAAPSSTVGVQAAARNEEGGPYWRRCCLAVLYLLLVPLALGVAGVSVAMTDNPNQPAPESLLITMFGSASWLMLPALVISAMGLVLGSRAWWTRWLPPCIFCAQLYYLLLLVTYEMLA
eukprot:g16338.t1